MFAHLSLAILAMFFISAGCSELSSELSHNEELSSFSEVTAWQIEGTLPDSSNTKPMVSIGLSYRFAEKASGLYEIKVSNQSAFNVTGYALLAETKSAAILVRRNLPVYTVLRKLTQSWVFG